jgi:transposase-like protein
MTEPAWMDVTIIQCPKCKRYYAEVSWYVTEMESDIECADCGTEFNTKTYAKDRAIIEFEVNNQGRMQEVKLCNHIKI